MPDPSRRDSPGSWPRDRPVRWGALGRSLSTFAVSSAAILIQFALVVPLLGLPSESGDGWLRTGVALVWGIGTLWAAWCWVTADRRGVLAPVVTIAVIWLAGSLGPVA